MKAPSLPSLRSMILSMERKCFSVVVFFLFVFRGLYAPIFTHKVNWRFVFLIFFVVFWECWVQLAVLHIQRGRTIKKNNEEAFSINTQTSEKLSMGKKHGLVFGAQSRNDIFVVMIHCRRMVSVILLHEWNYTRRGIIQKLMTAFGKEIKRTHILKIMLNKMYIYSRKKLCK